MGGFKPSPAPAPAPAPAAPVGVFKRKGTAGDALRRKRIAEGRTGIVSTDGGDGTWATKKLLGA